MFYQVSASNFCAFNCSCPLNVELFNYIAQTVFFCLRESVNHFSTVHLLQMTLLKWIWFRFFECIMLIVWVKDKSLRLEVITNSKRISLRLIKFTAIILTIPYYEIIFICTNNPLTYSQNYSKITKIVLNNTVLNNLYKFWLDLRYKLYNTKMQINK